MSDTTASTTPTPTDVAPRPPAQATEATTPEPKVEDIDWKAEARKWEARAKENKTAAETASQTEAQRVAAQLAEFEERTAKAEAKASRRDVALEFRLSKDDAALLDAITDEKAMRSLAQRLAGEADKKQNHVPGEGTNPTPQTDSRRQFADFLTGRNNT